jgi:hypothetical protein
MHILIKEILKNEALEMKNSIRQTKKNAIESLSIRLNQWKTEYQGLKTKWV